jgi:rubrerythrin
VPSDPRAIVRSLVEEACVGETLGVAEALALADACVDPALSAVHRRIAADEQRHAELAWRTLGRLLARDPSLASAAREGSAAARALLEVPDAGESAVRAFDRQAAAGLSAALFFG